MKKCFLFPLLIWPLLLPSLLFGHASGAKTDLQRIQGTWIQTKRFIQGKEMEPGFELAFDVRGDKLVLSRFEFPGESAGDYSFSLDESKGPKWFTWTCKGHTQLGIYEITNDELKINFHAFPKNEKKPDGRPKDFTPRRGTDIFVLKRGKLLPKDRPDMDALLKQWEEDVRQRMDGNPRRKKLAAEYPLVVLHSRYIYQRWGYERSSFSFNHETADAKVHRRDAQLMFSNGGVRNSFNINLVNGQHNIVVDLGLADFTQDPDPREISIDDRRIQPQGGKAVLDHVYLQRVHDSAGNRFYVLFQVVGLDTERGRYMAFLWRRLPGGKVVTG
jgi:uncharacterized protein (TIGR03067 family)